MVKIPSLSRRSEPAPTQDENVDGRDTPVGDRANTVMTGGRSNDGPASPVVTDRDADQTTYRSGAAPTEQAGTAERPSEQAAERRAAERAAVARAATARPMEGDARSTTAPSAERIGAADTDTRTAARSADTDTRTAGLPADTDTRPGIAPTRGRTDERDTDLDPTARRSATTDGAVTDRPVDPTPDRADSEPAVVRGPKPRASFLATLGLIVAVAGALFVLTGTLAGYGIGLGAFGAVLSVLGLMATRRRHVAGKTDALFGILIGLSAVVIGVLAMTGQFVWPTTDGDWVQRFREWLDSQFVDRF
ncbi:DMT family transporter [Micromonospora sp. NRRL B-16802]|uniref:DMT family transporter n=1 Tax=Micromonospora sp. NRRL B-16802 TaxID=1415541 RepID=UPI0006AE1432|nr:DMT family transporter [Micromonospora sp. NRRL B-16802]